jgi:HEAT repeat protein
LRGRLKEFEQRNVQVLAVLPETVDELLPSVKAAAGDAAFPVVADLAVTVSATYGQGGYGSGVDPATFVIDREGVIRFEHRAGRDFSKRPVFDRPTVDKVLRVVDGLGEKRLLLESLKDHRDAPFRKAIALAMGPADSETRAGIPVLGKALRDEDVSARRAAAAALWYLAAHDEGTVAALARALADRDAKVRLLAVETLSAAGPKAKSALPALIRSLRDADAEVRTAAVEGLWMIGPDAKTVVLALAASLKGEDPEAAKAVAFALAQIREGATQTRPAIIEMLQHENAIARQLAADALGRLGKADAVDPAIVAALVRALKDTDSQVRRAAAEALKKVDPEAAKKAGVQ